MKGKNPVSIPKKYQEIEGRKGFVWLYAYGLYRRSF